MRSLLLAAALLALGLAIAPGCESVPPVPTSSDPEGKDIVKGAIVAATESSGGVRLYKVIHIDDYPPPIGWDLHMIVYDPKAPTFQDAAILHKRGGFKVLNDHILVRLVNFLTRDHRVLKVEPVTDAEEAPYIRARDSSRFR